MESVYLTPKSFDLTALYMEAAAIECEDVEDNSRGVKRPAESLDSSRLDSGDASSSARTADIHAESSEQLAAGPPSKNRRNHERRRQSRIAKRSAQGRQVHKNAGPKYVETKSAVDVDVKYIDLPVSSCGFHGTKEKEGEEGETVEELLSAGWTEWEWDGIKPQALADKTTGKIVLVLVGRPPNDEGFVESANRVTELVLGLGDKAQFTPEECEHRRSSDSAALNFGAYYGGGMSTPTNLNNGRHDGVVRELLGSPDLARMAAFADSAFKLWMPRVYKDVDETLNKLYTHNPGLKKNWPSVAYPCAAMNFGPRVCCKQHKDFGNAPQTFCAIQAFGRFDAAKGGHLRIEELRLIIRFPATSTILLPSAMFTHSNTPVASNEIRISFTQFVPGGLMRYTYNDFTTEARLKKKSKKKYAEKMEAKSTRWKEKLGLISTLEELKGLYSNKDGEEAACTGGG